MARFSNEKELTKEVKDELKQKLENDFFSLVCKYRSRLRMEEIIDAISCHLIEEIGVI